MSRVPPGQHFVDHQWYEPGDGGGRTRYRPFGNEYNESGTITTDKLYTGQQRETGAPQGPTLSSLYHYGARIYNSDIGRFISADTIVPEPGNPQALNRYSYVLNNPLRYTDPTGHRWVDDRDAACNTCGAGGSTVVSDAAADAGSNAGFGHEFGASLLSQGGGPGSYQFEVLVECFVRIACGPNGQQSRYGEFLFPVILGEAVTPWPEEWLTPAVFAALIAAGLMASDADISSDTTILSQGPFPVYVVRGGEATPQNLVDRADPNGGISVNSAPGLSKEQLSVGLPHAQISWTTTQKLAQIGYTVVAAPTADNPYHALILTPGGITMEQATTLSTVFTREPNPARGD